MAEPWNSLPSMMLDLAARHPRRAMLRHWDGAAWRPTDWGDFGAAVARVAAGLRAQGVRPDDRVLIVSENRPEFPIAETALLALGAIVVPTYVTNAVADDAHILADSGATAAIVSTAALAARVEAAARTGVEGGRLSLAVAMAPAPGWLDWSALLAEPGDQAALAAEAALLSPERVACLIYTSGTSGMPKGTMLPHRSMLANQASLEQVLRPLHLAGERYVSFLPLSHSYEHTIGNYLLLALGMEVIYSRGADRLVAELQQFDPALITVVPRLFEVFRARIEQELSRQKPWKRALFDRAVSLGLRRLDGPPLGLLERLQDRVLDRLVRRAVRHRFGKRAIAVVSGGARLDPDLSGFFLALGVPVLQGYGQTEAGPVISVNLPWDNDRRSVGRPMPDVEVALAEDGELLVRGQLAMIGYWNRPEATATALRERPGVPGGPWLHTGDIATLPDGRIVIHDRKRDFIKLASGEMVSPAKLESQLMAEPEIAQAVVAGEGRAQMVALLVPAEGADPAPAVRRVNQRLPRLEQVRRWSVIPPATIENGQLTPSMKVKRNTILTLHASAVEALYPGRVAVESR